MCVCRPPRLSLCVPHCRRVFNAKRVSNCRPTLALPLSRYIYIVTRDDMDHIWYMCITLRITHTNLHLCTHTHTHSNSHIWPTNPSKRDSAHKKINYKQTLQSRVHRVYTMCRGQRTTTTTRWSNRIRIWWTCSCLAKPSYEVGGRIHLTRIVRANTVLSVLCGGCVIFELKWNWSWEERQNKHTHPQLHQICSVVRWF